MVKYIKETVNEESYRRFFEDIKFMFNWISQNTKEEEEEDGNIFFNSYDPKSFAYTNYKKLKRQSITLNKYIDPDETDNDDQYPKY